MKIPRWTAPLAGLAFAAALLGQETEKSPPSGFDRDACVKHCGDMAAMHQKAMDGAKADREKHEAAWKEIRAQLAAAQTARGEKKVAALEAAIEKLVAFHESMMADGMAMGCGAAGSRHAGEMDCCRGMAGGKMECGAHATSAAMDCCAGGAEGCGAITAAGKTGCCAGPGNGAAHCGAEKAAGGK